MPKVMNNAAMVPSATNGAWVTPVTGSDAETLAADPSANDPPDVLTVVEPLEPPVVLPVDEPEEPPVEPPVEPLVAATVNQEPPIFNLFRE